MATVSDPYAAALLPETDQRLWVVGLTAPPAVPYDLAAVLALAAACDPVRLAYAGPPVELIPACLIVVSGSFQLAYPKVSAGDVSVAALAVVLDNPAALLVGVAQLDSVQVLRVAGEALLADVDIAVAQQPGA